MFRDSFQDAFDANYQGLTGSTRYNVDYSILGTSDGRAADARHPQRHVRRRADGRVVEGRVQLRPARDRVPYDEVLRTADNHVVFKAAAKELADAARQVADLHGQVRRARGQLVPRAHEPAGHGRRDRVRRRQWRRGGGRSRVFSSFVAGVLATLREFTLLYAPSVNSYKRYQPGSFAPTAVAWGEDNRTCALRVVGHGPGLRVENRVPGGDVNPYLAQAAMLAGRPARRPQRAGAGAGLHRQRLRRRLRAASRHAARRARGVRRRPSWPRRRSARTSSRTTCGPRTSSWRPSRPR